MHAVHNPFLGPDSESSHLGPGPSSVVTGHFDESSISAQPVVRPSLSALHALTAMLPTPRHTVSPAPTGAPSQSHIPHNASHSVPHLKKTRPRKSAVDRLNEEAEAFKVVARRMRKGKKQ